MGNFVAIQTFGNSAGLWRTGEVKSIPDDQVEDWAEHIAAGMIAPVEGAVAVEVGDAPEPEPLESDAPADDDAETFTVEGNTGGVEEGGGEPDPDDVSAPEGGGKSIA